MHMVKPTSWMLSPAEPIPREPSTREGHRTETFASLPKIASHQLIARNSMTSTMVESRSKVSPPRPTSQSNVLARELSLSKLSCRMAMSSLRTSITYPALNWRNLRLQSMNGKDRVSMPVLLLATWTKTFRSSLRNILRSVASTPA